VELLGQGREAEVFLRPDGAVLKLLRPGFPETGLHRELAAMRALAGHDGLVPRPVGIVTTRDRPGLVMERIPGADLLSTLARSPWRLHSAGPLMAAVHARVHAVSAPAALPDLRAELDGRIRAAAGLPDRLRSFALSTLDGLPDGDRLCHGDLHLGNILDRGNSPVVIDWGNAARGDPVGDVARTLVLHRHASPPPGSPLVMRVLAPPLRNDIVHRYLRAYRRLGRVSVPTLRRWEIVHTAARLSERIEAECSSLLRRLEAALARADRAERSGHLGRASTHG